MSRSASTPLGATTIPDAAYTGALIAFFAHLGSDRTEPDWNALLWTFGAVAALGLVLVAHSHVVVRDRWPRLWAASLTYCVLTPSALFMVNTDVTRFLVFVVYLLYAIWFHRRFTDRPVEQNAV